MLANVAAVDVALRRRSLFAGGLVLGLFVFAVVGLYQVFIERPSLVYAFKNPSAAAVFGISGSLTSSAGWLNAFVFSSIFPFVLLLLTITYGAWAVAGQREDGTLGLMSTLALHRPSIVLQKLVAMTMLAAGLGLVVAALSLLGQAFGMALNQHAVLTTTGAIVLLGVDFGLIAMAIAAISGRRRRAVGLTALLAVACYALGAAAQVVNGLQAARYVSPFFWAVQDGQLSHGANGLDFVVLGAVALTALAVTLAAFQRLDLH